MLTETGQLLNKWNGQWNKLPNTYITNIYLTFNNILLSWHSASLSIQVSRGYVKYSCLVEGKCSSTAMFSSRFLVWSSNFCSPGFNLTGFPRPLLAAPIRVRFVVLWGLIWWCACQWREVGGVWIQRSAWMETNGNKRLHWLYLIK